MRFGSYNFDHVNRKLFELRSDVVNERVFFSLFVTEIRVFYNIYITRTKCAF